MHNGILSIKILSNMIFIQMDESAAIFDYIRNYIGKNFSYPLILLDSMIVFSREPEKIKRKIFLECLYQGYLKNKENPPTVSIEAIRAHNHLPIYIKAVKKNKVSNSTTIMVKVLGDGMVSLRMFAKNQYFVLYFRTFFKFNIESVNEYGTEIILKLADSKSINSFKKLLHKKLALGNQPVIFLYNKAELNSFFEDMESAHRYDYSYYAKFTATNNAKYFTILNSTENDSFEVIKRNYLLLIKQYHPDTVFGQDAATVERYTNKFRTIQEAFETVKNIHKIAS